MTARQIRRVTPVASGPPLAISLRPIEDQVQWRARALCAETDPDAFFPERGASTRAAKNVCRGCEVISECLEFALDTDQRFGVWGGKSERELRALRRLRGQGQEVAA